MSKTLVLLVLAVVWGVALIPPLLRSRADHRGSSIHSFRRSLSNLSRIPGAVPAPARGFRASTGVPSSRRDAYGRPIPPARQLGVRPRYGVVTPQASARAMARRRRQNILLTLVTLCALTGLLGLGAGIALATKAFFVAAAML